MFRPGLEMRASWLGTGFPAISGMWLRLERYWEYDVES
jgi:hypothetical protein